MSGNLEIYKKRYATTLSTSAFSSGKEEEKIDKYGRSSSSSSLSTDQGN